MQNPDNLGKELQSAVRQKPRICEIWAAWGIEDLYLCGHVQFGGIQLENAVETTEDQDRDDDGKITDQDAGLERMQENKHGRHHAGV